MTSKWMRNIITAGVVFSLAGAVLAGAATVARAETEGAAAGTSQLEDSPEWITSLDAAQDAEQLFVVAGIRGTTASVSMHEKDADGNWKQILSTPGFIGKKGLGKTREGDAKTPVGTFTFNYAFGIAEDPGCALEYHQVDENSYWSGDQRDGYHYNEMVDITEYPDLNVDDSERIVDYKLQYQYCLNVSYNADGTPGLGSAIFLHCLGPFKPYTGGCIAIPQDQMIKVMQNVREDCVVVIDSLEVLSPETWDDLGLPKGALPEEAAYEEKAAVPAPDADGKEVSAVIYLYSDGSYSMHKMPEADAPQLTVPEEYKDELIVKTGEETGIEGGLFSYYEKASVEAEKALAGEDGEAYDGAGWLFAIGTVSAEKLHEMLCGDMSGAEVFAEDEDGNYYIFYHPTDVRIVREDNNYDDESVEGWTKLNEWAGSVKESFVEENEGLTAVAYDNSDVAIALSRAAYMEDASYTVSTTQYGPLEPADDVDAAAFAERLTRNVKIEYADMEEGPDGEYVVLNFPEEGVRYDFFLMEGGENIIRRVYEEGGDDVYYTAVFEDEETTAAGIMQEWYDELAAANGKSE